MRKIHPMGARSCDQQKIDELYEDPNYIAEKKFDGSRYILSIINHKAFLTSRCESVHGGMCNKTDNVPHIIKEVVHLNNIILDGEMDLFNTRNFSQVQGIMGSLKERAIEIQKDDDKKIYYKCFDVLQYNGINIENKPFKFRRKVLEYVFKHNKFKYILLTDQTKDTQKKRELFDDEIDKGSEGIILKNINSIYVAGGGNRREGTVVVA